MYGVITPEVATVATLNGAPNALLSAWGEGLELPNESPGRPPARAGARRTVSGARPVWTSRPGLSS